MGHWRGELLGLHPPGQRDDLEKITRFEWDREAIGELDWFGYRMDRARKLERRWHEDGLIGDESAYLIVAVGNEECAGVVEWRPVGRTDNIEIGIALFPEHGHELPGGLTVLHDLDGCIDSAVADREFRSRMMSLEQIWEPHIQSGAT